MTALLILVGMAIFTCVLFWNIGEKYPVTAMAIVFAAGGLIHLTYPTIIDDTVALWTSLTTGTAAAWAYSVASSKAFFGGMATAWGWMGFGLAMTITVAIILCILWPLAKSLARVGTHRAEAKAAEAERQAAEERQGRIDAEKRADAAEGLARRAVAGQAEAERLYAGLIGQFHQAVSMADRRGRQLREGREKKRAENGVPPVQRIEKAAPPTNGQDKKPPGARRRKKPGKGRSPKRSPSRLPSRLPGR